MRALAVVCVLCATVVAAPDERPWAKGVSADDQKAALALYDEGNKFFEESEYKEALEKYELALKHWQHPAIFFNAAVCLHHLDQDVKAAEYIEKATAYKDAPFDKKTWAQVGDYKTLFLSLVTELEVSCTQADAKITLDTEVILPNCPAVASRKVAVQQDHVIIGEKPGYETKKLGPIRLVPGKKNQIELILKPLGKGKLVRRWGRAIPWYVVAGGGIVAASAYLPFTAARTHTASYDAAINNNPECVAGCIPAKYLTDLHDRAQLDLHIAQGLVVAGGVIALAGVAMVVLNQPHFEKAPAVAPSIGPDHAGVVVFGHW